MKSLALLLALLFAQTSIAGLPPTSLKGQDGSKFTNFNFEAPHKQATKTATGGLVETGNPNLLVNPGGEHVTAGQGWSSSTTAPAASITSYTSTNPEFGKKNLQLNCNGTSGGAGTCTFYQDVTTSTSLGGMVSVYLYVENGVTATVSSRRNGSVVDVVEASEDGSWHRYDIPSILGTTSTGVQIDVTVGATDAPFVLLDGAVVGAMKVTEQAPLITAWEDYTPTITNFGTVSNIDCKHRQVGSSREIECKFTSVSPSGSVIGEVTLPNGEVAADNWTSIRPVGKFWNAATSTTHGGAVLIEGSRNYLSFSHYGIIGSINTNPVGEAAAGNSITSGGTLYFTASVPIKGLSSAINTYTQRGITDLEVSNEFTAVISATGGISSQNIEGWVASCTNVTTPVCTLATDLVTVPMNCEVTSLTSGYGPGLVTSSATEVSGVIQNSAGTAVSGIRKYSCTKVYPDFKSKTGIIGTFEQLAQVATIKDVKAALVEGGGITAGSWVQRVLNTLDDDYGIVKSLSANRFTLPSGVYEIHATAPAFSCIYHQTRIVSDPAGTPVTVLISDTQYSLNSSPSSNHAIITGIISLTEETVLELQHRVSTTRATNGLGLAGQFSEDSAFAQIKIRRLK